MFERIYLIPRVVSKRLGLLGFKLIILEILLRELVYLGQDQKVGGEGSVTL